MQRSQGPHEPAQRDTREFVYELKFLVDETQAGALKEWARWRLSRDPYGQGPHGDTYLVSSLYFDTTAFAVLAREGSYGRCKYRVRRYNHGDTIFLERKTRGAYRVFKRRSASALDGLQRLQAQPSPGWEGHWFHRRLLLRGLQTVSRVDYQRFARVASSDYGPVRLTLDEGLQTWTARHLSFEAAGRPVCLSCQQQILELKFGYAMPAVFKELIRDFAPRLQSISKYRMACLALGLAPPRLVSDGLGPDVLCAETSAGATRAAAHRPQARPLWSPRPMSHECVHCDAPFEPTHSCLHG